MKETKDQELRFVVSHYEAGRFSPEEALKKIGREPRRRSLKRWVAAAASVACIAVFAAVFTWQAAKPVAQPSPLPAGQTAPPTTEAAVASFHFDNTPLPEVLKQLERHYGVQLQVSDSNRCLTGTFRGETLDDIVRMIEEVLDVDISR